MIPRDWHDEDDSLEQLIKDIKDSDNPQHGTPDSIRESAWRELRRRGYAERDITEMRLGYKTAEDYGTSHC